MTTAPARPERPRRGSERSRHLADYLALVRNHLALAAAVFLVVLLWKTYDTLSATPVYQASATLQIPQTDYGYGRGPDELLLPESTEAETEMQVLRSYDVALGAAHGEAWLQRNLSTARGEPEEPAAAAGRTPPPPTMICEDLNAYRPMEILLQRLTGRPGPCRLDVWTDPPEEGETGLDLRFDDAGRRLTVTGGPDDAATVVEPFTAGAPFQAAGRTLRIDVRRGSPAGKHFRLTLRSLDATARWIQGGVSVDQIGRWTGVLTVTHSTDTPDLAARLANLMAQSYLVLKQAQRQEQLAHRVQWLGREIDRVQVDLARAETERDEYVAKEGAVLLGEKAKGILDEQAELSRQRFELDQRLKEAAWRRDQIRGEAGTERRLLMLGAADPRTTALMTRLVDLQVKRDVLVKSQAVTGEFPELKSVEAEIAATRASLDSAVRTLADRRLTELDQEIVGLETRVRQIDEQDAELDRRLGELPKAERELAARTRPVAAGEEILGYLMRWKKEAEVGRASALTTARLIDPAVEPQTRSKPNLFRSVLLALVLGTLASLGAVVLVEYLDRRLKTPQALEDATGLTLYATIPAFRSVPGRERRGVTSALVARDAPSSVLAETYRTLRANIRFAALDRPVKTLAISSAVAQEGKTVTTLNLAVAMAQAGNRVIVVDADMRRPSTHVHLGGDRAPGLAEVLEGTSDWRQVARPTPVANLTLVPAGRATSSLSALLDSERLRGLLAELREAYDYVLFDVPPVLAVADAASFAAQLDGMFLLTRYRRCTADVVRGARDQIERLGARLLGAIFNGFDARRASRSGYGYYGYYGSRSRYAYGSAEGGAPPRPPEKGE